MNILIIDGVDYSDKTVASVDRKATIKDSELSGEMMDGSYHRDIIGTYIDYEMKIVCKLNDPTTYNQLFELLSSPVASHEVTVPYNNETVTFDAYIKEVSDHLKRYYANGAVWVDLKVLFKAAAPQKVPV